MGSKNVVDKKEEWKREFQAAQEEGLDEEAAFMFADDMVGAEHRPEEYV